MKLENYKFYNIFRFITNVNNTNDDKIIFLKKYNTYITNLFDKKQKNIKYEFILKNGNIQSLISNYIHTNKTIKIKNLEILKKLLINLFTPFKMMENYLHKNTIEQLEFLNANTEFMKLLNYFYNNNRKIEYGYNYQPLEFIDKERNENIYYSSSIKYPSIGILHTLSDSEHIDEISVSFTNSEIEENNSTEQKYIINKLEEYLNNNLLLSKSYDDITISYKKDFILKMCTLYRRLELKNPISVYVKLTFNNKTSDYIKYNILEYIKLNGIVLNDSNSKIESATPLDSISLLFLMFNTNYNILKLKKDYN